MILATDQLTIEEVPIAAIHVTEHQQRYPDRVTHYVDVLGENRDDWLGLLIVKPYADGYEILDGHHRFVAYVLAGRPTALCVVVEPEDPAECPADEDALQTAGPRRL